MKVGTHRTAWVALYRDCKHICFDMHRYTRDSEPYTRTTDTDLNMKIDCCRCIGLTAHTMVMCLDLSHAKMARDRGFV